MQKKLSKKLMYKKTKLTEKRLDAKLTQKLSRKAV